MGCVLWGSCCGIWISDVWNLLERAMCTANAGMMDKIPPAFPAPRNPQPEPGNTTRPSQHDPRHQ
jgi:hypothetical protein